MYLFLNIIIYFVCIDYTQALKAQSLQRQRQLQLQQQQQGPVTLQQCLREYCKQETLEAGNEWYCSTCRCHQKATKVMHIHTYIHTQKYIHADADT